MIRLIKSRFLFWTVGLPLFVTFVWKKLDANPSLWFYDGMMRLVTATTTTATATKYPSTLVNQTVWLTGASSGIGASLVCSLIEARTGHVIMSSRNTTELETVRDECREKFPDSPTIISVIPYDAMKHWKTQSVVQEALQEANSYNNIKNKNNNLGSTGGGGSGGSGGGLSSSSSSGGGGGKGIDILILNHGVYQTKRAIDTTIDETRRITRINYEAPVELALELMKQDDWKERGRGGKIVISASVMAKGPQALCSSYSASKAALVNYFQTLSTEEFTWLKVYTAIIGGTKTDMWEHLNYDVNRPDDSTLMDKDRVASLMVRVMTANQTWGWWVFHETWLSKNIGLAYILASMYTPNLFHLATHMIGLARTISLERDHTDLLSLKPIIQNVLGFYMGY